MKQQSGSSGLEINILKTKKRERMMKKVSIFILLLSIAANLFAEEINPSIVVMNFYYKDISKNDMSTSTTSVTEALENTELFDVMNIADRNTILEIKKYDVEGCVDPECQAKAARALGVDIYLAGDIGRLANKYILHIAIIDAITGEVVLEGDTIYADFTEMIDNMKKMTYEICGIDPATMPQDDVLIIEKEVFTKVKLSKKDIASLTVIGAGGVALIVGGIFLFDANNYYLQEFRPAYNYYMALDELDADYSEAFYTAESDRQVFTDKLFPGIIIGGAGVVTILAGVIIGLIPEKEGPVDINLQPTATGLSVSLKF